MTLSVAASAIGTAFLSTTGTTGAVTTQATGSTFLVAALGMDATILLNAPTDSKGNAYSATPDLTILLAGGTQAGYAWVKPNGLGGASHTFTVNVVSNMLAVIIAVEIKSTAGFAVIDRKAVSSNQANVTTAPAPSVTPLANGAIVLSLLAGVVGSNTTITDATGYNNILQANANGASNGNSIGAIGAFLQAVAAATNDIFTIGVTSNVGTGSISFITGGAGPAPTSYFLESNEYF